MKRRIVILMFCLSLVLSGCVLFPLKENEKPLVRSGEEGSEVNGEEYANQLVKPAELEAEEDAATRNLVYCVSPVNVREAGDASARVLGALRTGDAVTKVSQEGVWVEIIFEGRTGYVYVDYVSETAP